MFQISISDNKNLQHINAYKSSYVYLILTIRKRILIIRTYILRFTFRVPKTNMYLTPTPISTTYLVWNV